MALTPEETQKCQAVIEIIQKNYPNAFSKEGIKKLIGAGLMDFDAGAKSIENIDQVNIIQPENAPKRDTEVKNLVNPVNVKMDIVVEMTKHNDAMLYNTYKNTLNDLHNISKTMVEKAGNDFSSMLGHIESLLDEGDGDSEVFKKLRETKLKII